MRRTGYFIANYLQRGGGRVTERDGKGVKEVTVMCSL